MIVMSSSMKDNKIMPVKKFLEWIDIFRTGKPVPRVLVTRLTDSTIEHYTRPHQQSFSEDEDSLYSSSETEPDPPFTFSPTLPLDPLPVLAPPQSSTQSVSQLSTTSASVPQCLTPASNSELSVGTNIDVHEASTEDGLHVQPHNSVASKETDTPERGSDIDDVLDPLDPDFDGDLPDLTDPTWEAPANVARQYGSHQRKKKKKKMTDTGSFGIKKESKLMKSARKAFEEKSKIYRAVPQKESKSPKHLKSLNSSPDARQAKRANQSTPSVTLTQSVLSSNTLTSQSYSPTTLTVSAAPDKAEIDRMKSQLRQNIIGSFQKTREKLDKVIISPESSAIMIEDSDNENSSDGLPVPIISSIQGNATNVHDNNVEAEEAGYDSDATVSFEESLAQTSNLPHTSDLDQGMLVEQNIKMDANKRKHQDSGTTVAKKFKSSVSHSESPPNIIQTSGPMVVLHSEKILPVSSQGCPLPTSSAPRPVETKNSQFQIKQGSKDIDVSTGEALDELSSNSGPKTSLSTTASSEAPRADSGKESLKPPGSERDILSKVLQLTNKCLQCEERIKQLREEYNKRIEEVEKEKASYEKEIQQLIKMTDEAQKNRSPTTEDPKSCLGSPHQKASTNNKIHNNSQKTSSTEIPGSLVPDIPLMSTVMSPTAVAVLPSTAALVSPVSSVLPVQLVRPPSEVRSSKNNATEREISSNGQGRGRGRGSSRDRDSSRGRGRGSGKGSSRDGANTENPRDSGQNNAAISIIRQANINRFGKKTSPCKKKDDAVTIRVSTKDTKETSSSPMIVTSQVNLVETVPRSVPEPQLLRNDVPVAAAANSRVAAWPRSSPPVITMRPREPPPPNVVISNLHQPPPSYMEHIQAQRQSQMRGNIRAEQPNSSTGTLFVITDPSKHGQQQPSLLVMSAQQSSVPQLIANHPQQQQQQQQQLQQQQQQQQQQKQQQLVQQFPIQQQQQYQFQHGQQLQGLQQTQFNSQTHAHLQQPPQVSAQTLQQQQIHQSAQSYSQQPQQQISVQHSSREQQQSQIKTQPHMNTHSQNLQQQPPLANSQSFLRAHLTLLTQPSATSQVQMNAQQLHQQPQMSSGVRPVRMNVQPHNNPEKMVQFLQEQQQKQEHIMNSYYQKNVQAQQIHSSKSATATTTAQVSQISHASGSTAASTTVTTITHGPRPSGSHQTHLLVSATPATPQHGLSIALPAQPTLSSTVINQPSDSLPQLSPHQPQNNSGESKQENPQPETPFQFMEQHSCFICGSVGEYTCCSGIIYCSADCQGKDWERHRDECVKGEAKQ